MPATIAALETYSEVCSVAFHACHVSGRNMANLSGPTHLFISYASEDSKLAAWLARKLSILGYRVWFDQLKMLGGEPWPQEIDDAIKNRTFRMLALISEHSISKPKPTKERTLGQRIAEQRKIKDFIIPLKLDSAELDWMTTDLSYIPFSEGWADGLARIVKKLDSIEAPKLLKDGPFTAMSSLVQWRDIIRESSETVIANVMEVKGIPLALLAYKWKQGVSTEVRDQVRALWNCVPTGNDGILSLTKPPVAASEHVEAIGSQFDWQANAAVLGLNPRNAVSEIVLKEVRRRALKMGFTPHPKRDDVFYLSEEFSSDGKLHFTGIHRKMTWLKIKGRASYITLGKPREVNFHHFAVSIRLARGISKDIWLKITPTLFFVDERNEPIIDDRVGPRRRRLTKTWWNNKWANRLLAIESLFLNFSSDDLEGLDIKLESLLRLDAPYGINEELLVRPVDDEDGIQEPVFVIDEEISTGSDNE